MLCVGSMKIWTNLLVVGGVLGVSLVLKRIIRVRRGAGVKPADEMGLGTHDTLDEDMRAVATRSGIADVDPVPLSHVAGEGIDPERDVRAHQEIHEIRDRMPRS